jgi:hypothetical protein
VNAVADFESGNADVSVEACADSQLLGESAIRDASPLVEVIGEAQTTPPELAPAECPREHEQPIGAPVSEASPNPSQRQSGESAADRKDESIQRLAGSAGDFALVEEPPAPALLTPGPTEGGSFVEHEDVATSAMVQPESARRKKGHHHSRKSRSVKEDKCLQCDDLWDGVSELWQVYKPPLLDESESGAPAISSTTYGELYRESGTSDEADTGDCP